MIGVLSRYNKILLVRNFDRVTIPVNLRDLTVAACFSIRGPKACSPLSQFYSDPTLIMFLCSYPYLFPNSWQKPAYVFIDDDESTSILETHFRNISRMPELSHRCPKIDESRYNPCPAEH